MKIHIIAAALPPRLDGIGDYTACLAAELAKSATVTVLTGAPAPDPIPGVRVETAFSADNPASVKRIAGFVEADRPDWVLLQYNPFSFGRWGLNLHLPRVLSRIKRGGPRFALMVHEPFVPIISPQFAVMATWQRWQLRALGRSADRVFFSIDPWAKRFQRWFPRTPVTHLPVGSNIPLVPISRAEAKARLGIPAGVVVLGLFGTASSGRLLDRTQGALTALRAADVPVRVLYVGPHKAAICAALGDADVIADGPFPADEVSRRLSAMDVYLAAYIDGVSTRRGAFIAALQHGVATVGTRGPLTDAMLEREDGRALLLADVGVAGAFEGLVKGLAADPEGCARLGQSARSFHDADLSWGSIAAKMMSSLEREPSW